MDRLNTKTAQVIVVFIGLVFTTIMFGKFGIISILAVFIVLGFFIEKWLFKRFSEQLTSWFDKIIPFPQYIVKLRDTGLEISFICLMAAAGLSIVTDPIQFKPLHYEINPILWLVSLYCAIASVFPSLVYLMIYGVVDFIKSNNVIFDKEQIKQALAQRKKKKFLIKDFNIFSSIVFLSIGIFILLVKLSNKLNPSNLLKDWHIPEKVKPYIIIIVFLFILLFLVINLIRNFKKKSPLEKYRQIGFFLFILSMPVLIIHNILINSKIIFGIAAFLFLSSLIILSISDFIEKRKSK